jgi:hypothetical protein
MTGPSKKILNRPHALPQNFMTYKVAYEPEGHDGTEGNLPLPEAEMLENPNLNCFKLKGLYNSKSVISKLFGSIDGYTVNKKFLNLENHKISALVPEVVLYKVYEEEGNVRELRPFYFPVAADYLFSNNKINLSKPFSGNNASIDSFNVTFTSQEVYEATRKFVEASLSISVDHMATLFEKEDSTDYAPLADLFTISAGSRLSSGRIPKSKSKGKTLGPNALDNGFSCRVAATMGYNVPRNGMFDSSEIQTIESSKAFINLYYAGHSINFDQNGSVKVDIKYTGYLSAVKSESMYNLITSSHGKLANAKVKSGGISKSGGDINKLLGEKAEVKKQEKSGTSEEEEESYTIANIQEQFGKVLEVLHEKEKIYGVPFSSDFFAASGHLKADALAAVEEGVLVSTTNLEAANAAARPANKHPEDIFRSDMVNYVLFGDFVAAYLHIITKTLKETEQEIKKRRDAGEKKDGSIDLSLRPSFANAMLKDVRTLINKLKNAKILFSDFETETIEIGSSEPKSVSINIADVPVTLDTIYTYVYRNLALTKKFFFNINEFLTKMCLQILNTALVEKPSCEMLKDVSFVVNKVNSRKMKSKIDKGKLKIKDFPAPVGNFSKNSGKDMVEYVIFHQAPQVGNAPGSGNLVEDAGNGIFHLNLGQTHGLLKTVSFDKISDPGRETYLVVKNGRAFDELRLPHNATAEMVGNFMFLPMSFVYINPDTVGFGDPRLENSSSRRLGLGGYYVVGNVSTTYSAGELKTTLQLHFNGFPDADNKTTFGTGSENEEKQKESISKLKGISGSK